MKMEKTPLNKEHEVSSSSFRKMAGSSQIERKYFEVCCKKKKMERSWNNIRFTQ
jgi:hypothetical protein